MPEIQSLALRSFPKQDTHHSSHTGNIEGGCKFSCLYRLFACQCVSCHDHGQTSSAHWQISVASCLLAHNTDCLQLKKIWRADIPAWSDALGLRLVAVPVNMYEQCLRLASTDTCFDTLRSLLGLFFCCSVDTNLTAYFVVCCRFVIPEGSLSTSRQPQVKLLSSL